MKGKTNVQENTARRNRSFNSGIRHHHSGSSWIRWIVAKYSSIRGSQGYASGNHKVGFESSNWIGNDAGSVTAEFAIILPATVLILFAAIQVLSFQSSRVGLIELAAELARSQARGEEPNVIESLIQESAIDPKPTLVLEHREYELCVELTQIRSIAGLGSINLSERQCARKSGL